MKLFKYAILFMAGIVLLSGVARAESPGQEKLLAKRAALADAYRNLGEKIDGLQIDSQTYVRDFVAASDQVRTSMDTFIKGAQVTNTRYLPDGTCEVEVAIKTEELVREIDRVKKQLLHLGHWQTIYVDKIKEYYTASEVKATGSGAPRGAALANSPSVITENIPGWENVTPQGRLMAQRAALVDAYRNLAESVKGLRIDAQTYVRDFVADSDQIRTELDTWIKGMQPVGNYRYLPDGICEVDIEVPVREVVVELVKIRKHIKWWQTTRYETIELEAIENNAPSQVVRATGSGVPPAGDTAAPAPVQAAAPAWVTQKEVATGTGIPPKGVGAAEARVMAERAAKLDAMRNLAEKIYGVSIDSTTTVRDFVTQQDQIKAEVETFLRGAEVVDTRYLPDGSVEVDVAADMQGVWDIYKKYRQ